MTYDDRQRRDWMEGHLDWAAKQFDVTRTGTVIHSGRLRSVGSRIHDGGDDAWLRVVYEDPDWGVGAYLEGNVTANDIRGVPKPSVSRWTEWDDNGRKFRGEISTFVADAVVSREMVPTAELSLSDRWLAHLRAALDALAAHPVPDHGVDPEYVNNGLMAFFGISVDFGAVPWTAAHCDLHWGNVTTPNLFILDWETWGKAPTGYDAATLHCSSLLYPRTANRIHDALSDFLDTPSGRVASLTAAVRFLRFIDGGEYRPLARPLRQYALEVIESL